ncbi:MAG: 3',5'-cyclic-AMP phosphodiesterase [Candidatus Polarisedimenticolaceae bacterium]|nr:3',5'-cyclic-AMP phosphodiesterase [Candidatus Polarisedimenticolaceae bacterium]
MQISDTHITADEAHRLVGLNTLNAFKQVIEHAKQHLSQTDLVIATGDLTHDSTDIGYSVLQTQLERLNAPIYYLPGNHDRTDQLLASCAKHQGTFPFTLQQGAWAIILLDTSVIGKVSGHISERQLADLDQTLSEHADKHTLIALHHHPVKIGSAWMDNIALKNADALFAVLDKHPQVKGALYGHIHQCFEQRRNGVEMMGSPSTCIQFAPKQDKFGIDEQPPGYRWLVLLPDGTIQTGIKRLESIPGQVDLESKGY